MRQKIILISVIVIFLLAIFNMLYIFYGSNVNLTGNVIKNADDKDILLRELKDSNHQLRKEKEELNNNIKDLESQILDLQSEKENREKMCTAKCEVDEICTLITKADGSLKSTCIRDPSKVLGV